MCMKTAKAFESFEVLFEGTGLLLSFNLRSNEVDQGCKFIQAELSVPFMQNLQLYLNKLEGIVLLNNQVALPCCH